MPPNEYYLTVPGRMTIFGVLNNIGNACVPRSPIEVPDGMYIMYTAAGLPGGQSERTIRGSTGIGDSRGARR